MQARISMVLSTMYVWLDIAIYVLLYIFLLIIMNTHMCWCYIGPVSVLMPLGMMHLNHWIELNICILTLSPNYTLVSRSPDRYLASIFILWRHTVGGRYCHADKRPWTIIQGILPAYKGLKGFDLLVLKAPNTKQFSNVHKNSRKIPRFRSTHLVRRSYRTICGVHVTYAYLVWI